jgi:hypothetical protein
MIHGCLQFDIAILRPAFAAIIWRPDGKSAGRRRSGIRKSTAVPTGRLQRLLLPMFVALLLSLQTAAAGEANDQMDFVTGSEFRSALEQAFSTSTDNDSLRGIVRGIETAKHVSIVVDRRLDPTGARSMRVTGSTLKEGLERLAAEADAGATIIGNSVYFGPRATAAKLRTLQVLRIQELSERNARISDRRRSELTQARTFRWNDLDRPADLIRRLASEHNLALVGIERVPHDLWAGGTLPDAGAVEILTLILAQFDLTFGWSDQGAGITIEQIPDRVATERSYDPPAGLSAAAAISRWQEELPDLVAREEKGKIIVSGTEEMHEVVKRVRRGGRATDHAGSRTPQSSVPLNRRRYSLKIQQKPASAILNELAKPENGEITFEFSRADFKAASIDLDQLVTFEVQNVTIDRLLKATLDPLGVDFEIRDRTVRLMPTPRPDQ